MIELGHTYSDRVTQFRGIAIAYVQYLTGCNRVLLQPQATDDAKRPEPEWIDEQCCAIEAGTAPVRIDNGKHPGFGPEPPKG